MENPARARDAGYGAVINRRLFRHRTSAVSYKKCQSYEADYQKDAAYDRSPRAGTRDRIALFFECETYFSSENAVLITAIATVVIGVFTLTLWSSNRKHVRHVREVERAYISGGGPIADAHQPSHQFVLTIQNYGKTPGFIHHYAVEVDSLAHVQSNPPAYRSSGYIPRYWEDSISPNAPMKEIARVDIPAVTNPVAYGRFWYTDIWGAEHYFGFILPLYQGNDHSTVERVRREYTRWT